MMNFVLNSWICVYIFLRAKYNDIRFRQKDEFCIYLGRDTSIIANNVKESVNGKRAWKYWFDDLTGPMTFKISEQNKMSFTFLYYRNYNTSIKVRVHNNNKKILCKQSI